MYMHLIFIGVALTFYLEPEVNADRICLSKFNFLSLEEPIMHENRTHLLKLNFQSLDMIQKCTCMCNMHLYKCDFIMNFRISTIHSVALDILSC